MSLLKCLNISVQLRSLSSSCVIRAVCYPAPRFGPMDIQRCEMINGIKVAAAKTAGTPMAACTIMFQAGSRYETGDQLGACHFIRAMSPASGYGYTSFSKMRVLQQRGAYITCTSNRQMIAFTLRCPAHLFSHLKYYLLDTAICCCYNEWDVSERMKMIKEDLFHMTPEQRVIDLLQTAYWAGPLANSIFCHESRINSMTGETLNSFVKNNFQSTKCTVASVGVPFDETMKLAEKIQPYKDRPEPECGVPSRPRSGFECHDDGPVSDTWLAVALPSCGTGDVTDLIKFSIIAHASGTDNINMGQHDLDRTPQPPLGQLADIFTTYKCFNISYEDAGLLGVLMKSKSYNTYRAAQSAVYFLTNICLDSNQVAAGKKRLKLSLMQHCQDSARVSEDLALQVANNAEVDQEKLWLNMIDLIKIDDVIGTAKNLGFARDKMALAIVGDLNCAPTDVELMNI